MGVNDRTPVEWRGTGKLCVYNALSEITDKLTSVNPKLHDDSNIVNDILLEFVYLFCNQLIIM